MLQQQCCEIRVLLYWMVGGHVKTLMLLDTC